jgi:hypothetical protein
MHADHHDPDSREFHVVANLSTDDPHWREATLAAMVGLALVLQRLERKHRDPTR